MASNYKDSDVAESSESEIYSIIEESNCSDSSDSRSSSSVVYSFDDFLSSENNLSIKKKTLEGKASTYEFVDRYLDTEPSKNLASPELEEEILVVDEDSVIENESLMRKVFAEKNEIEQLSDDELIFPISPTNKTLSPKIPASCNPSKNEENYMTNTKFKVNGQCESSTDEESECSSLHDSVHLDSTLLSQPSDAMKTQIDESEMNESNEIENADLDINVVGKKLLPFNSSTNKLLYSKLQKNHENSEMKTAPSDNKALLTKDKTEIIDKDNSREIDYSSMIIPCNVVLFYQSKEELETMYKTVSTKAVNSKENQQESINHIATNNNKGFEFATVAKQVKQKKLISNDTSKMENENKCNILISNIGEEKSVPKKRCKGKNSVFIDSWTPYLSKNVRRNKNPKRIINSSEANSDNNIGVSSEKILEIDLTNKDNVMTNKQNIYVYNSCEKNKVENNTVICDTLNCFSLESLKDEHDSASNNNFKKPKNINDKKKVGTKNKKIKSHVKVNKQTKSVLKKPISKHVAKTSPKRKKTLKISKKWLETKKPPIKFDDIENNIDDDKNVMLKEVQTPKNNEEIINVTKSNEKIESDTSIGNLGISKRQLKTQSCLLSSDSEDCDIDKLLDLIQNKRKSKDKFSKNLQNLTFGKTEDNEGGVMRQANQTSENNKEPINVASTEDEDCVIILEVEQTSENKEVVNVENIKENVMMQEIQPPENKEQVTLTNINNIGKFSLKDNEYITDFNVSNTCIAKPCKIVLHRFPCANYQMLMDKNSDKCLKSDNEKISIDSDDEIDRKSSSSIDEIDRKSSSSIDESNFKILTPSRDLKLTKFNSIHNKDIESDTNIKNICISKQPSRIRSHLLTSDSEDSDDAQLINLTQNKRKFRDKDIIEQKVPKLKSSKSKKKIDSKEAFKHKKIDKANGNLISSNNSKRRIKTNTLQVSKSDQKDSDISNKINSAIYAKQPKKKECDLNFNSLIKPCKVILHQLTPDQYLTANCKELNVSHYNDIDDSISLLKRIEKESKLYKQIINFECVSNDSEVSSSDCSIQYHSKKSSRTKKQFLIDSDSDNDGVKAKLINKSLKSCKRNSKISSHKSNDATKNKLNIEKQDESEGRAKQKSISKFVTSKQNNESQLGKYLETKINKIHKKSNSKEQFKDGENEDIYSENNLKGKSLNYKEKSKSQTKHFAKSIKSYIDNYSDSNENNIEDETSEKLVMCNKNYQLNDKNNDKLKDISSIDLEVLFSNSSNSLSLDAVPSCNELLTTIGNSLEEKSTFTVKERNIKSKMEQTTNMLHFNSLVKPCRVILHRYSFENNRLVMENCNENYKSYNEQLISKCNGRYGNISKISSKYKKETLSFSDYDNSDHELDNVQDRKQKSKKNKNNEFNKMEYNHDSERDSRNLLPTKKSKQSKKSFDNNRTNSKFNRSKCNTISKVKSISNRLLNESLGQEHDEFHSDHSRKCGQDNSTRNSRNNKSCFVKNEKSDKMADFNQKNSDVNDQKNSECKKNQSEFELSISKKVLENEVHNSQELFSVSNELTFSDSSCSSVTSMKIPAFDELLTTIDNSLENESFLMNDLPKQILNTVDNSTQQKYSKTNPIIEKLNSTSLIKPCKVILPRVASDIETNYQIILCNDKYEKEEIVSKKFQKTLSDQPMKSLKNDDSSKQKESDSFEILSDNQDDLIEQRNKDKFVVKKPLNKTPVKLSTPKFSSTKQNIKLNSDNETKLNKNNDLNKLQNQKKKRNKSSCKLANHLKIDASSDSDSDNLDSEIKLKKKRKKSAEFEEKSE